ncbi:MAG: hypothetical protein PHD31_03340, partial [Candidatus Pacebacteria bacterium]|nr:hypothetical protein [Candidatus Paceibacterota bacterium]
KKMCKRVGADYSKIVFDETGWFLKYSWTIDEEESFVDWLVEYLHKNKDARRTLMNFPSFSKKSLRKFATKFVFTYGWKFKKINN